MPDVDSRSVSGVLIIILILKILMVLQFIVYSPGFPNYFPFHTTIDCTWLPLFLILVFRNFLVHLAAVGSLWCCSEHEGRLPLYHIRSVVKSKTGNDRDIKKSRHPDGLFWWFSFRRRNFPHTVSGKSENSEDGKTHHPINRVEFSFPFTTYH